MRPEEFYGSDAWKKVRALARQRAGGLCEECLKKGIIKPAEAIHHKTPITPQNINDPKITLNLDNLVALCADCHAKMHHPTRKRYKVDRNGKVIGID